MYNKLYTVAVAVIILSITIAYLMKMKSHVSDAMAANGLLFVSSAAKTYNFCLKSSRFVKNILYIKYLDGKENSLSVLNKQIVNIYSKAAVQTSNIDVRLLLKPIEDQQKIKTNHAIDLILYESSLDKHLEGLKQAVSNLNKDHQTLMIDSDNNGECSVSQSVKTYDYVALGGTFDRLHNGHKILLSQAALRAKKHVTVGVTDVNMIKTKVLWELIEPVEKRIKAVRDFLTDINPDLEYNVLPIQDMYGPTKDDPKIQLIVVSEETARAVGKINDKRKENSLQPLDEYIIGLAQDDMRSLEEEAKLSSSNQRRRLLGTMLRPPQPNPNIPKTPYVIGLTGGIASGKSNITEKIRLKGAAVVNCDLIAHDLYKPGLPLNRTLAETFGSDIITPDGEVDRRKLGQIVFSDKSQLERLNQTVWPAIIEEARNRIRILGEQGYKVVVMEAAVMVRAKWYEYCHQLWAVIIPPEEAIKRLQVRNNQTEEEARQRVDAQPTNSEQIAMANIVFSPYWSYEYTQQQIDRAWENLQPYLRE
ncbi:unnamed protein product [Colias eurytheme]|nr:unnamed protein product [Colias eurytheme]